jgi:hypothetical protein
MSGVDGQGMLWWENRPPKLQIKEIDLAQGHLPCLIPLQNRPQALPAAIRLPKRGQSF